jgi:hypothetical protein
MGLVRIKTFDEPGELVYTEDQRIIIDTETKHITIICKDEVTARSGNYDKVFIMEIANSFRVPIVQIVDGEMQPVWENPEAPVEERVQQTIGEYDMMHYYNTNKLASIPETLTAAILRRKGLNPNPNVFVQV